MEGTNCENPNLAVLFTTMVHVASLRLVYMYMCNDRNLLLISN